MKKLLILLPIILMSCTKPDTPQQAVFAAENSYAIALRAELAYSNLPRCGKPTSPIVCSDVSVIKKLQKSDDIAWIALKDAETAVRTPGYGDSKVTTTVASATALVKAFASITDKLGVK